MNTARPFVLLFALLFSAIAGIHIAATSNVPVPLPHVSNLVAGDPLTEAIKSGVTIRLNGVGSVGTGILIGRTKTENGNWRYRVLTAYHVLEDLRDALTKKPEEAEKIKKMTIVYQDGFHAPLTILNTSLIDFDWMVPSSDWGIFSMELAVKLPCAQLATKEEFESIQPYDHIYGLGSDNADGLFLREGIIASTNGTQPFIGIFACQYPWDINQDDFFRVYHGIFYGASGGPVFNRQGKVIGIYNGLVHTHMGHPVTNLAVVLKGHTVRELLEKAQSTITKVEN